MHECILYRLVTCADDQTKVVTRWLYRENTDCGTMNGEITNYYDDDFRYECQWWMGLAELPERIETSALSQCFKLTNGTIKYSMEVCCLGKTYVDGGTVIRRNTCGQQ